MQRRSCRARVTCSLLFSVNKVVGGLNAKWHLRHPTPDSGCPATASQKLAARPCLPAAATSNQSSAVPDDLATSRHVPPPLWVWCCSRPILRRHTQETTHDVIHQNNREKNPIAKEGRNSKSLQSTLPLLSHTQPRQQHQVSASYRHHSHVCYGASAMVGLPRRAHDASQGGSRTGALCGHFPPSSHAF